MNSNKIVTDVLLDELLSVFYHKFIYYAPSEIIIEGVIDHIKEEIEDDFFDEFYFLDNYLGSSKFNNEDAIELNTLLADKRAFLQQNLFKLVERSKNMTEFEFLVVIEKYHEFLLLFTYIAEWLSINLKKYNGEDIQLSIIGAFGIQLNYFKTHLNDICKYFKVFLDLKKEFDFSMQVFVPRYLSELISRYGVIVDKAEELRNENGSVIKGEEIEPKSNSPARVATDGHPKKNTAKMKKQPELDLKKIEFSILMQLFNVKEEVLQ